MRERLEAQFPAEDASPLEEAVRAVAIVPRDAVRRLKRIALDTRCVLTAEDANWLLEFAESLDGEGLPPTERAPQGYPA